MLEISDKGLVIERLDSILTRLAADMRQIYGSNININPDTPDGQMLGIFAQGLADINEAIAGVYAFSDPTKAVGTWLDIQLKYVGSSRVRPKYSYLNNVELRVAVGTIIPKGFTVVDENRNEWVTLNAAKAAGTTLNIAFRSAEYGAFDLTKEQPLTEKTIVLGVGAITNKADAELGNLQESDAAALARFLRSYQQNNINDVEGLEGALLALPDVRDVLIYENYTNTTDSKGVRAHTINTVIVGGNDMDIAKTIQLKKTMGCGLQGDTTVNLFYRGMERPIRFDRAKRIDVSVKVTVVRRDAGTDVSVSEIKEAIASNQFMIAEDVIAGSLYCGVNNRSFKVKSLVLSTDTLTDELIIPIGLREYGSISAENVEVLIE